jgi:hypothetical protein
MKAFSMTKKTRIRLKGSGNASNGGDSDISKTLEDLELQDAIELVKKKFHRSPFCSLSQLKADDLLTQLEQIAIDEKKYRPLQSESTSSTQGSQSNSGFVDLEDTTDDTSVVSSTPRPGATHMTPRLKKSIIQNQHNAKLTFVITTVDQNPSSIRRSMAAIIPHTRPLIGGDTKKLQSTGPAGVYVCILPCTSNYRRPQSQVWILSGFLHHNRWASYSTLSPVCRCSGPRENL